MALMEEYKKLRQKDLEWFKSAFLLENGHYKRKCPVCNVENYTYCFEKDGFDFVKCKDCDCLFVNPVPSDELLTHFYDGFESMEFFHSKILLPTASERHAIFKKRVDDMKPFINKQDKIFEIGTSMGFFVNAALKEGWDVSGVEINSNLVDFVRTKYGVDIHQGLFENVKLTEKYDVIVMWEVLEHIVKPGELLKKVSSLLNSGGRFMATLPNIEGVEFQVCGPSHEMIEAPGHLNYFSERTLKQLLEKCGFTFKSFSTPGILDFVNVMNDITMEGEKGIGNSFLLKLHQLSPDDDWKQLEQSFVKLIQKNNLSGNMFVVAEKS